MFFDEPGGPKGCSLREVVGTSFPNVDIDRVLSIIAGDFDGDNVHASIIASLVRSSIDVRVIDYLVRDSYHAGIPSGMGIDAAGVINSFTLVDNNKGIGITRNGVFALEHLLCARHWMFNRVYWNRQNRAISSMLRFAICALTKEGFVSPLHLVRNLMMADEGAALVKLQEEWGSGARSPFDGLELLRLLQEPRPRPYRTALTLSARNWSPDRLSVIEEMTYERIETLKKAFLHEIGATKLNIGEADVLFDVPKQDSLKLGEDVKVAMSASEELQACEARTS
jgi:HD superfamily phosphohydrolase